MEFGASFYSYDGQGQTLLHKMIEIGDFDGISFLEEQGALRQLCQFQKDEKSPTALHVAAYQSVMKNSNYNKDECDKLATLIEKMIGLGADINASFQMNNDKIFTPMTYAKYAKKVHRKEIPEKVVLLLSPTLVLNPSREKIVAKNVQNGKNQKIDKNITNTLNEKQTAQKSFAISEKTCNFFQPTAIESNDFLGAKRNAIKSLYKKMAEIGVTSEDILGVLNEDIRSTKPM